MWKKTGSFFGCQNFIQYRKNTGDIKKNFLGHIKIYIIFSIQKNENDKTCGKKNIGSWSCITLANWPLYLLRPLYSARFTIVRELKLLIFPLPQVISLRIFFIWKIMSIFMISRNWGFIATVFFYFLKAFLRAKKGPCFFKT